MTEVWTKSGIKNINEVVIGDEVLCDNNSYIRVANTTLENSDTYYVEFQDGRFEIVSSNQLWDFHPAGDTRQKVKDTLFIKNIVDSNNAKEKGKRLRYPIVSLPNAIQPYSEVSPMKPYTLGAILGDGYINPKGYCVVTNLDYEIMDSIKSEGYDICDGKSKSCTDAKSYYIYGVNHKICSLDLQGKKSATKFVPDCIIKSSIEDRFSFIQGIMDTDGYVCSRGNTYYDTVSEDLAKGVQTILRSLGFTANYSIGEGSYVKNGVKVVCKNVYSMYIRGENQPKLFNLKRKVDRCKNKNVGIRIEKVENLGINTTNRIVLEDTTANIITTNFVSLRSFNE